MTLINHNNKFHGTNYGEIYGIYSNSKYSSAYDDADDHIPDIPVNQYQNQNQNQNQSLNHNHHQIKQILIIPMKQ